jgi:uncharacterized protein (TIRG00374 family)
MKVPWLTAIFTLIILYVAVTQLDLARLAGAFQLADVSLIILSMVPWVILIILKSFKWQRLVISLNGKISLKESLVVLFIGLFVSVITPGRLGDFVRAFYIKDRLVLGRGILAVIVDRAMDIITLLIFAGVGLILLSRAHGIEIISPELVIVLIVACVVGLFVALNKRSAKKLFILFQRFIPEKIRELIVKHGRTFYEAIPLFRTNSGQIILAFVSSTLAWMMTITFGWLLMQSLHLQLDWVAALSVIPILALVEIIPVGVLGIGTREIAAVIILGANGVSPEHAIAFSLLYFTMGYVPSFLIGAVLFNRKPIQFGDSIQQIIPQLFKK